MVRSPPRWWRLGFPQIIQGYLQLIHPAMGTPDEKKRERQKQAHDDISPECAEAQAKAMHDDIPADQRNIFVAARQPDIPAPKRLRGDDDRVDRDDPGEGEAEEVE